MNDFPKEEFIYRIEKIQIHIEKENIDAVIITSPSNFRYFTGLDSNFWESPTRPWYLIISKKNPIKAFIGFFFEIIKYQGLVGLSQKLLSSPVKYLKFDGEVIITASIFSFSICICIFSIL